VTVTATVITESIPPTGSVSFFIDNVAAGGV
jgi:hypothetical protein